MDKDLLSWERWCKMHFFFNAGSYFHIKVASCFDAFERLRESYIFCISNQITLLATTWNFWPFLASCSMKKVDKVTRILYFCVVFSGLNTERLIKAFNPGNITLAIKLLMAFPAKMWSFKFWLHYVTRSVQCTKYDYYFDKGTLKKLWYFRTEMHSFLGRRFSEKKVFNWFQKVNDFWVENYLFCIESL